MSFPAVSFIALAGAHTFNNSLCARQSAAVPND